MKNKILSKEEAFDIFDDFEEARCAMQNKRFLKPLFSTTITREDLFSLIGKSQSIVIAGRNARRAGYRIAIQPQGADSHSEWIFVSTEPIVKEG